MLDERVSFNVAWSSLTSSCNRSSSEWRNKIRGNEAAMKAGFNSFDVHQDDMLIWYVMLPIWTMSVLKH